MDVLAIILACSLHPDDQLVRTLIDVQSSGNRFFVGDLSTLKTNDSLRSAQDALRFAEDIRRQGGRPAVGLLGVPLEWAARFGRAPVDLFDACTNVSIATAVFDGYYQRCSMGPGSRGTRGAARRAAGRKAALVRERYCIVTSFARDLGVRTAAPVILRELIARTGSSEERTMEASPERSAPLVDTNGSGDGPGRQRLFLEPTAVLPAGGAAAPGSSRTDSR
jgi:hypothetical protein